MSETGAAALHGAVLAALDVTVEDAALCCLVPCQG